MSTSTTVREKVAALVAAINRVETAEAELAAAKAEREHLETKVLPEAFGELGIAKVTIDGVEAKLSTMARGSLPKDEAERRVAIDWLAANGYADFVKCIVASSWGRGEYDKAKAEYDRLRGDNSAVTTLAEDVHWKTLCKIAKDRFLAGQDVPLQTLGVTILPRVTIPSKRKDETDDQ